MSAPTNPAAHKGKPPAVPEKTAQAATAAVGVIPYDKLPLWAVRIINDRAFHSEPASHDIYKKICADIRDLGEANAHYKWMGLSQSIQYANAQIVRNDEMGRAMAAAGLTEALEKGTPGVAAAPPELEKARPAITGLEETREEEDNDEPEPPVPGDPPPPTPPAPTAPSKDDLPPPLPPKSVPIRINVGSVVRDESGKISLQLEKPFDSDDFYFLIDNAMSAVVQAILTEMGDSPDAEKARIIAEATRGTPQEKK